MKPPINNPSGKIQKATIRCYKGSSFIEQRIIPGGDNAVIPIQQHAEIINFLGHCRIEQTIILENPNNNDFSCGSAEYKSKDYDSAIEYFDSALKASPENPKFFNKRGLAKSKLKRWAEAIKDFDAAIKYSLKKPQSKYFKNRADAKANLGQADSITDYDQAISIDRKILSYLWARAKAKHSLGYYEKAIQDYTELIEKDSRNNNSEAFKERGIAQYFLGQYDLAFKDFDQSIKLDPCDHMSYFYRALTSCASGSYQQAIKDLDRIINLESDNPLFSFLWQFVTQRQEQQHEKATQEGTARLQYCPEKKKSIRELNNKKNLAGIKNEKIIDLLQLPSSLEIGIADDDGCFFDALAQSLNQMEDTSANRFNKKDLRNKCYFYYQQNNDKVNKLNNDNRSTHHPRFHYGFVRYTKEELEKCYDSVCYVSGELTDGIILCKELNLECIQVIELEYIENTNVLTVFYRLITKKSIKYPEKDSFIYNNKIPSLVVFKKHFAPLLVKTNTPILQNYPAMFLPNQGIFPDHPQALRESSTSSSHREHDPENLKVILDGLNLYHSNNYEEAVKIFEQALQSHSENFLPILFYYIIATCQLQLKIQRDLLEMKQQLNEKEKKLAELQKAEKGIMSGLKANAGDLYLFSSYSSKYASFGQGLDELETLRVTTTQGISKTKMETRNLKNNIEQLASTLKLLALNKQTIKFPKGAKLNENFLNEIFLLGGILPYEDESELKNLSEETLARPNNLNF